MTRKSAELGPALLVGGGIIVATAIAMWAAESGWLVMAAPLVLALAGVGADVLGSRLRGAPSGPSPASLLLGGTLLLTGAIVTLRDPGLVKILIPVVGSAGYVTLLFRPDRRRQACRIP